MGGLSRRVCVQEGVCPGGCVSRGVYIPTDPEADTPMDPEADTPLQTQR